jgi:hypothetical protein
MPARPRIPISAVDAQFPQTRSHLPQPCLRRLRHTGGYLGISTDTPEGPPLAVWSGGVCLPHPHIGAHSPDSQRPVSAPSLGPDPEKGAGLLAYPSARFDANPPWISWHYALAPHPIPSHPTPPHPTSPHPTGALFLIRWAIPEIGGLTYPQPGRPPRGSERYLFPMGFPFRNGVFCSG